MGARCLGICCVRQVSCGKTAVNTIICCITTTSSSLSRAYQNKLCRYMANTYTQQRFWGGRVMGVHYIYHGWVDHSFQCRHSNKNGPCNFSGKSLIDFWTLLVLTLNRWSSSKVCSKHKVGNMNTAGARFEPANYKPRASWKTSAFSVVTSYVCTCRYFMAQWGQTGMHDKRGYGMQEVFIIREKYVKT